MRLKDLFQPAIDVTRFASVTATSPHAQVSSRYGFISTMKPLAVLADLGWKPVSVAEQNVRITSRQGFQTHAVRLRNEFENRSLDVGQTIPELLLTNSHMGNASFRLSLALFELICSNGLVVERGQLSERRVLHVGYQDDKVEAAVRSLVPFVPQILSNVDRLREVQMNEEERLEFARRAFALRWDSEKFYVNPRSIENRRPGQRENTLWNVFNTAQEILVSGGFYRVPVRNLETRNVQRARAIGSIAENERLNRGVWQLMEEFSRQN